MMTGMAVNADPNCSHSDWSPVRNNPVAAPTSRIGAASPAARASDSTTPVRMPGAAAGSTWLRVVSHLVAPTPNAPSRTLYGTARSDSEAVMITMGNTSADNARPPAQTVRPRPKNWTNRARPSRPYTIDGTPARLRTLRRVNAARRDLPAYSSRYTAHATPSGMATTMTMTASS